MGFHRLSPCTALAPWGGGTTSPRGKEFEHRQVRVRRPKAGWGATVRQNRSLRRPEVFEWGLHASFMGWRQGRGVCPPSHLTVVELRFYEPSHSAPFGCSCSGRPARRTPRQPHLAPSVLELRSSHLRCSRSLSLTPRNPAGFSNSVLSGRRSPERRSPNGDIPTIQRTGQA